MGLNHCVFEGRIGRDPEIKYFESGSCKASFSIAIDRWSKKEGKLPPIWLNVEAWGTLAEAVGNNCRKGQIVIVSGRMDQQEWQDKSTGEQKNRMVLNAMDIVFAKPVRFGDDDAASPAPSLPTGPIAQPAGVKYPGPQAPFPTKIAPAIKPGEMDGVVKSYSTSDEEEDYGVPF